MLWFIYVTKEYRQGLGLIIIITDLYHLYKYDSEIKMLDSSEGS